jgi:hypothetical protein
MSRFNIELLYQKTRILLHRNYLTAGQCDARFSESRRIVLQAARQSLEYQNVIFHACQPGGALNRTWWYMSSLNTYDFLLAAMVLCLELSHLRKADRTSKEIPELLGILENTCGIWMGWKGRARESVRGAAVLRAMIDQCSREGKDGEKSSAVAEGFESAADFARTSQTFEATPESIPSDSQPQQQQHQKPQLPPQIWGPAAWPPLPPTNPTPPLDILDLDLPQNQGIDWTLWDSAMQGQTTMHPQGQSNIDMDQWMNMTTDINFQNSGVNMHDFHDPMNLANFTGYSIVPQDEMMNWGL